MTAYRPGRLYSPQMLALATGLADYPLDPALPLYAETRSRTCGGAIRLGLALDEQSGIARIGMQVSACAIGQASAMLLAQSAYGAQPGAIKTITAEWEGWLAGEGALPDWPSADILMPARDHPGRHGALMLPWKAASMALSSAAAGG